jgi:spermidine synthase
VSALLPLCFVVSGATSLILQVVWVRKLIEVFGSSTLAITTVLAAFMGGLALGAHVGGIAADRLAARRRRPLTDPLLYYGLAEAVVGLSALGLPLLVASFRGPNAWLWGHLGDTPTLLALARFALTAAALLIPTTAMGATLPLLARRVTAAKSDLPRLGQRIGILYAANTFGALAGAGAAGFALIPALGASATGVLAAAAAMSLAAAVAAAVLWPRRRDPLSLEVAAEATALEPSAEPEPSTPPPGPGQRRLALAAYALSGAVAMGLEVLLARALAVVNGSSVYSFTLVLVVFLGGLSIGALAFARPASSSKNPLALLGALLAAAGAAIGLAIWTTDQLPALSAELLEGTRLEAGTIMAVHATVTGLTILPIAAALGAIMPVAIRCYVGEAERVGREVGRAYAANTVGAIAGSVITGFWLMPALSLEHSMRLFAVLDLAAGAALLAIAVRGRARIACLAIAALAAAAAALAPRWDRSDFTAGLFRAHIARRAIETGRLADREVVYYRDGIATTVSVERLGEVLVMKNNGKVEASSQIDMPTQILVGLIPVLLRGGRDLDVFVVGYGSGVTVGAIAQSPAPARIDVAEIEPAVYEAADRFFSEVNRAPQRDHRVTRLVGDGRNALLAGGRRYDVIVSEPSNPWIAGVASLFTREFYAFARRHLEPGGIFCQWAQLYELGPANVKMIYRTFAESFPHVYALTPGDETTDTILIGSLEPLALDLAAIDAAIDDSPVLAAELARGGVESAAEVLASSFLLPDEIAAFTAGASINTDDNALLEYRAPRDLLASAARGSFAREVRSAGWPYGRLLELMQADPENDAAMARALLAYGRRREAGRFLERARTGGASEDVVGMIDRLRALSRPRDFRDPELPFVAGGPPLPEPSPALFADPGRAGTGVSALERAYPLVAEGQWARAYRRLRELPERADSDDGRDISLLLGYLAYKSVALEEARRILEALAQRPSFVTRRPATLYYLGRTLYGVGAFRQGLAALERFAKEHPAQAAEAIGDGGPR